MKLSRIFAIAAAVAAISLISASAHAFPLTQFTSGKDGWTGGGGTAVASWHSNGGMDDSGYLQTIDVAGGQMLAISPAYGNQLASLGGLLSFDYNVLALGAGNRYVPNNGFGIVTIYSGHFYVTADLIGNVLVASNIVGTGWHEASLGLFDGLWTGNASLADVLANVTQVSIVTEYDTTQRWPDEVVGIDDFAFTKPSESPASSAVPEPPLSGLLAIGAVVLALRARRRCSA